MAVDQLRVDLADQHHAGDVDGLGVGDPQAVAELGRLAEPRHQLADLGAAAVDDDRPHADEAHQHDVLGEQREGVVVGRAGQGVAAVLDDDGLAGEAPDVRQRLDEDVGDVTAAPARRSARRTLTASAPDEREAGGLVEAEGDVGRLHRAAGGALGQVVERARARRRSRCARRSGP